MMNLFVAEAVRTTSWNESQQAVVVAGVVL
jgi:hypothetical protein